jgi:hypothetical protein
VCWSLGFGNLEGILIRGFDVSSVLGGGLDGFESKFSGGLEKRGFC